MWEALAESLRRGEFAVAFGLAFIAAIVALSWVARTLWNTNQALHRHIADLETKCREELEAVHEKRIEDAKEVSDRIIEYSEELHDAMGELSTAMNTLIKLQRNDHG